MHDDGSRLLIRFWLLTCLVLLVTTNEEAQEYYGVEQSEDDVVTELLDTDVKNDGTWARLQKATSQHSGHSDFISSVRRRLSSVIPKRIIPEGASGTSARNHPYSFCCASLSAPSLFRI